MLSSIEDYSIIHASSSKEKLTGNVWLRVKQTSQQMPYLENALNYNCAEEFRL